MTQIPTLYFVIPVLNEAQNLERLLQSFRNLVKEFDTIFSIRFILIDDGSTDHTWEIAEKLSRDLDFIILRHEVNQGPGIAFQTAFVYLAERLKEEDWLVTLEGDNTSRVELLHQMFHRAEEGYEVIFASPYLYGGGIINTSTFRVILSGIANTFVKEFLDIHGIQTVSSFFRLYRAPAIKMLQSVYGDGIIELSGFECMLEMLIKMIYLGMTISEVPMLLDTHMRVGKSKMKLIKTILAYLSLWYYKHKWKMMASYENS